MVWLDWLIIGGIIGAIGGFIAGRCQSEGCLLTRWWDGYFAGLRAAGHEAEREP